ncbi:MAG: hypothetical protein BWY96_02485 [Spirochaetes bacterium ADurb.BinA120]|nr:MAG: hypothetical protein BWY96_02485 [Spirochaetes bacterium ADurb.BinA120]
MMFDGGRRLLVKSTPDVFISSAVIIISPRSPVVTISLSSRLNSGLRIASFVDIAPTKMFLMKLPSPFSPLITFANRYSER